MYKQIVVLYLTGHVLGDFYFQSPKMSEKKDIEYGSVITHSLLYALSILLVSMPVLNLRILFYDLVIFISHMVFDSLKFFHIRKAGKKYREKIVFILDQAAHIAVIMFAAYLIIWTDTKLIVHDLINDYFVFSGISKRRLAEWVLILLIAHKPANIIVQKLIGGYKPKEPKAEFKKDNNVGRYIGTVERLVMVLLLSVQQYAAIGLVLTAKSIARYDKISKEKEFAEYYLLGTLISTLIVIVCVLCIL